MNQIIPILLLLTLLAACIGADPSITDSVSTLSTRIRKRRNDVLTAQYRFASPEQSPDSLQLDPAVEEFELLDIVILSSVDGKLHGLNRTTGRTLWSMTGDPGSSQSSPSTFDSLVRTQHSPYDSDREFFIIEPQSGDIYVLPPMASPTDSLQRLPFSMQQLVEMSPFTFPGDENRMFVGRKETSMMVIELETGKVKGTVNADKECFWDENQQETVEEIDLDELDGTKPQKHKLKSPELHIGRTDYHVRVHSRHQGVVQNLLYSSYGPNNIDRDKQLKWRRTPDDLYIQSLPNGQVLAFQIDGPEAAQAAGYDGMPIWGREFRQPIVAVFDVVTSPSRSNPLALLQPRPHLDHLFPKHSSKNPRKAHSLPEVTYVGLVGESLYAMGHNNFPLVVFDQEPPREAIPDGEMSVSQVCEGVRCLVGSRKFEPSSQWYPPPLLDAVPNVPGLSEERVSLDHRLAESVKSDGDTNESRASRGDVALDKWIYSDTTFRTWSLLACMVVLIGALARIFLGKGKASNSIEPDMLVETAPPNDGEKIVVEPIHTSSPSPTSLPPPVLELATEPEPEPALPPPTPDAPAQYSPIPPLEAAGEQEDGDESEKENLLDAPRRKGPRRRKRGKKKKPEAISAGVEQDEDELVPKDLPGDIPIVPMTPTVSIPMPSPSSSLLVSDNVLGFGSHGTVVYEGSLQGRAVAVKRLLQDFVTIAAREVELLQESDDHPNVIRYFYKESKEGFLYIALELCPASLADVIERPEAFASIVKVFEPKRALTQITAGLRHLHMLKIVHRDIKPQNILVSRPKNGQHRMLISDFGLCKKLDVDQTSFLPTAHGVMAAGTVGWRAPEILRGDVKLDEQLTDPDDLSSRGSTASGRSSSSTGGKPARLTKSVDVFALGCLFYYTLTSGSHPFGDRFEREGNIMKGRMNLCGLEQFGEEGSEAAHLISTMLDQDAKARPDTTSCLIHPFFWTPGRRLNFLQDASDRFEIMCRDPREPSLITLETGAYEVVGNDWHNRLDKVFVENLGKFRKYDGRSVQDLLRALRNKKHHYQDLPDHVKRHLGPLPEGFLGYFTRRFPALFLHVHGVVRRCGLARESMFRSYFELADS
ncbi:kinase-like protein [Ramaria rubella]|nr:kinase-like protein [Ramaria rubella]